MSYGWNWKFEEGPMTVTLELRSNELGEDEPKLMAAFYKAVQQVHDSFFNCEKVHLDTLNGCRKCTGQMSTHAADACDHCEACMDPQANCLKHLDDDGDKHPYECY